LSHIFISYSRKNLAYVDRLNQDFKKKGFKTWLDLHDIPFGSKWHKELSDAIQNSFAVVVVMTPEAKQSEWVNNEIHLAYRYHKEIFPFLLSGEPFDIFEGMQYVALLPERNFLPPIRFYKELASKYDREPQDVSDKKSKALPRSTQLLPKKLSNNLIDLSDWTDYARMGSNDYYGITMLALAFEELSEHWRAIYFLRKSHQLEPRIKDKAWMSYHHAWTEEYHTLLEAIISDPEFWLHTKS
jgi:hypothetical protein